MAWIEVLLGCAAWGYTREESLAAIKDAAKAYVENMLAASELDSGEKLPQEGVSVVGTPVVTISR